MDDHRARTDFPDSELANSLDDLRRLTSAATVRLIRFPGASRCTEGTGRVREDGGGVVCPAHVAGSPAAQVEPEVLPSSPSQPGDDGTIVSCVCSPHSTGETLALQAPFPNASTLVTDPRRVARLPIPHLMSARESLAGSPPEALDVAARGSALCREAIQEARHVMDDLSPGQLVGLMLVPLVKEELRHVEEDAGAKFSVKIACHQRFSRDVEVTLYRILNEALMNVRKHANAGEVTVCLESNRDEARLGVSDDGVGFDLSQTLKTQTLGGPVSMQRWAELAGGSCSLHGEPGKGTTEGVRIPPRETCGAPASNRRADP